MAFYYTPVFLKSFFANQFVAAVVHGFDRQVFVTQWNQHRKRVVGRYLLRQVEQISSEFDRLHRIAAIFRQQVNVYSAPASARAQVSAGVVDKASSYKIQARLPFARRGVYRDLLIVKFAGLRIFDFIRYTG